MHGKNFWEVELLLTKSASLYARMEPEVKQQAEAILSTLGIPASNAINMFYKQIILHNGIPFDVTIPARAKDLADMSAHQLDRELEKGCADMLAGRVATASDAFARLKQEL